MCNQETLATHNDTADRCVEEDFGYRVGYGRSQFLDQKCKKESIGQSITDLC